MNSEQKWLEARNILNNHPSELELQKAVGLVQEAVADNHAGAYFTLAMLYFTGNGFEKDKKKAFEYLQKSHSLGYERSKLMLAIYLIEGEFIEKDLVKAERFLRELAENGDVDACANLSQFIFDDTFPNKDKEEGVAWLRKAAELGHPTAMARLGQICGNRCLDEESHFWFSKAKSAGVEGIDEAEQEYTSNTYPQRLVNIIRYYETTKEYSKALELLERDANSDNNTVLLLVGKYFVSGIGEEHYGQDVPRSINIFENLSAVGNHFADYELGMIYMGGYPEYNIEQNTVKATNYIIKSAAEGDAEAQFVIGDLLYNKGILGDRDNKKAIQWIESAARQDHKGALSLIACSYLQDPDINTLNANNLQYEQDIEKGMELLRRAAELGDSKALYVLAICYQKGKHVEQDSTRAFELLQKCVQVDKMPEYVNLLGDFYRDGIGIEQNYEAASHYYQWAADNGDVEAMMSLSKLYEEGLGVEKNEEFAAALKARWWETIQWNVYGIMPLDMAKEQAKEGSEEAMYQLGQRYQQGNGVDQNVEVASDWWHKAAMKGHVPACHDLGIYYVFTKHDIENGLKWLGKSAAAEYALSYRTLGDIYLNGWGVEVDVERGLGYLTKAAEQDHEDTQMRLAGIYHDGEYVEKDYFKAKYWFEKYLAHDSADAHYLMGRCLFQGDMYEQDYAKALEHFTKAVKAGNHDASPYYINMLWYGNHATQNQEEVLATYQELADNNDGTAAYYLYTLYKEESVNKNIEKAIFYLKQSAEIGCDEALKEMGLQYMEDGIFDTDFKKANDYFAQAAERGNAIAMVNLAISYQVGRDVEKDMRKALDLYTSAAQAGEKYAAREAARIYLTGEENVIDVNYDKAIELLQDPEDDDSDACFLLSYAMNAKSEMKNCYSWELVEKAFGYMFKAAKAEHPEAMYRVGYSFMEGRGVIIDMELAKQYFEKALSKEHRVDEINDILSKYFSGDVEAQKYPRYVYWHRIAENNPALVLEKEPLLDEDGGMIPMAVLKGAAQCGDVNAASLLGILLLSNDPDKAKKYITTVVKKGYSDIADYVGKLFYNGNSVEQSFEKAAEYFHLGSEAGHLGCALSLGLMYTAEGVSAETEEYGRGLLQAVCEATDESSEEYHYASAQLRRIEERNSSGWSKISKGVRSIFGKK